MQFYIPILIKKKKKNYDSNNSFDKVVWIIN